MEVDFVDRINWDDVYGYLENSVKNENLWALGSSGLEDGQMHIDNIERMQHEMECIEDENYDVLIGYYGKEFFEDFLRVTDINIYSGMNRNMYIRCKVDGVQQMARKLSKADGFALNDNTDRQELAERYFKDVLEVGQGQEKGMKILL